MGKQINYYMEYESFLTVAQKALDLGFEIVKKDNNTGEYMISKDIEIVTPIERDYHFHLPEAGDIAFKMIDGKEYLDDGYSASGNTMIEAGYSYISDNDSEKRISRARLFCITGYYDDSGDFIYRPECITKKYNSLVRTVKKIAPTRYNDFCYVTDYCMNLKNDGFLLR